jgi:methyl-accepting chemotaxis protein
MNTRVSSLARLVGGAALRDVFEDLTLKQRQIDVLQAELASLKSCLDTLSAEDAQRRQALAQAQGVVSAVDVGHTCVEFDAGGQVLAANRSFCALLGYDERDIVGMHHRSFVDPAESGAAAYREFWSDLNAGKTHVDAFRRVTKSGSAIWIHGTYAPVRDETGRLTKVVAIGTDITAAKLREADFGGQLAAIGKSQAVIEFSLDGKVLDANANFLDVLGYTLADIMGQHHSMFVEPSERSGADYRLFWDKLGRGEFHAGQYKRIGKGGKEVWIQASYNPITDLNGKPFKIVKYATDVTAAKLKEADFSGQLAASTTACSSIRPCAPAPSTASSGRSSAAGSSMRASTSAWARAARRSGCRPPTTRSWT